MRLAILYLLVPLIGLPAVAAPRGGSATGYCHTILRQRSAAAPSTMPVHSGVLIELNDGRKMLGTSIVEFGPGHRGILSAMAKKLGGEDRIRGVLWMGELQFQMQPRSDEPSLVRANELSGEFADTMAGRAVYPFPVFNDVNELRKFLAANRVWDVSGLRTSRYGDDQSHLDPRHQRLKDELDLKNTNHSIGNILSGVYGMADFLRMKGRLDGALAEMALKLFGDAALFFELFGSAFREDTSRMAALLRKYVTQTELKTPEAMELYARLENVVAEWRDKQRPAPNKFFFVTSAE